MFSIIDRLALGYSWKLCNFLSLNRYFLEMPISLYLAWREERGKERKYIIIFYFENTDPFLVM